MLPFCPVARATVHFDAFSVVSKVARWRLRTEACFYGVLAVSGWLLSRTSRWMGGVAAIQHFLLDGLIVKIPPSFAYALRKRLVYCCEAFWQANIDGS